MPNWIENKIRMTGPRDQMESAVLLMAGATIIDFEAKSSTFRGPPDRPLEAMIWQPGAIKPERGDNIAASLEAPLGSPFDMLRAIPMPEEIALGSYHKSRLSLVRQRARHEMDAATDPCR
jgi:hypothetical protein